MLVAAAATVALLGAVPLVLHALKPHDVKPALTAAEGQSPPITPSSAAPSADAGVPNPSVGDPAVPSPERALPAPDFSATTATPAPVPQPSTPPARVEPGEPPVIPAVPPVDPPVHVDPPVPVDPRVPADPPVPVDPAPEVATFSAVSGEECPADASRGYLRQGSAAGWKQKPSGGWAGDGCTGAFAAVPMSGSAELDTADSALWWFRTGAVTEGSCALAVFVPSSDDPLDVAGSAAHYTVLAGTADPTPRGSFVIDQVAGRGAWIDAGTYPVHDGQIAVEMLTRGENPGGEHLAAAQVRADCRAN